MTGATGTPRRIAITGASGMIGRAVAAALAARGDRVVRLVRHASRSTDEVEWSPEHGLPAASQAALEGLDGVVHLAGESLAAGRWTRERVRRIVDSRVPATAHLTRDLAALRTPPRVLACASAIGIYGDRGAEPLTEDSTPGRGFLAELAVAWEAAADPARAAGIRVVSLRNGLVLARGDGVLGRMEPVFRYGLGGPVGRADAWWSWVAIADVAGLVLHAIDSASLRGPVNVTAPVAVTSRDFARALGAALRRPAWFPAPPVALRLVFGRMADEMLLSSAHVEPQRAIADGYAFRYPGLGGALAALYPARHA